MKRLKTIFLFTLTAGLLTACSSNDDETTELLYAIVKPEEAQLADLHSSDYVLTMNNIIAVNPETGEFKMKNTERIDTKAYPIPTQYVIQFYSEGSLLFEAKLNSVISSYIPSGLTFCHFLSDKKGLARYDLGKTTVVNSDGKVEGEPTEQQRQGMQRMYQILQKAGKTTSHIDYDFQFGADTGEAKTNVLFIQSSNGKTTTATTHEAGSYNAPHCVATKEIIYNGGNPFTKYNLSFAANLKGSDIIDLFRITFDSDKPMSTSDLKVGETFDNSQFKAFFYYTRTWMEAILRGTQATSGKVTVTDKKQVDGKDYVVLRLTDFRFDAIDKSCIYTLNGLVEFEDLHLRYQE